MNPVPPGQGIVRPAKSKGSPNLGPVAVMVSNNNDLRQLCRLANMDKGRYRHLFNSRLYGVHESSADFCSVGPIMGAPYAAMVLETLTAWGVRKIIYFGWCGAVSPEVKIGDIVVPQGAIIDEGTSRHYRDDSDSPALPSKRLLEQTVQVLREHDLSFHEGLVWTTDAVFRETPAKIEYFQSQNALAVEMELSALFTVGAYCNVEVAGILVVSDEVSSFTWRPGFKQPDFLTRRQIVAEVISVLCKKISILP